MSKTADEFVVAGYGSVYVAPYGTALPNDIDAALNAAFQELGYSTEDGITFGHTVTVEDIMSWQSRDATRRITTGREFTIATELQQWNTDTFLTVFGGGTVTTTANGAKFVWLGDDEMPDEVSVILEFNDGTRNFRAVVARATVVDGAEIQLTRTTPGTLPLSMKALKPNTGVVAYLLTDDDTAFTAAS